MSLIIVLLGGSNLALAQVNIPDLIAQAKKEGR